MPWRQPARLLTQLGEQQRHWRALVHKEMEVASWLSERDSACKRGQRVCGVGLGIPGQRPEDARLDQEQRLVCALGPCKQRREGGQRLIWAVKRQGDAHEGGHQDTSWPGSSVDLVP